MSNEDNRNDENDQQIEESEQDVSVTEAVDAETSTDDEGMRSDAIDPQTNVTTPTPDDPPFEADEEPQMYSVQCTNKRTGGTTIVSATEMTRAEAVAHIESSVQYDHVTYAIVDYVDPEFDTSTD